MSTIPSMDSAENMNIIFNSLKTGRSVVINTDSKSLSHKVIHELIATKEGIKSHLFKLIINGKYLETKSDVSFIPKDDQNTIFVTVSLEVLGGKGGFGSMLRAIGAQIEKTTNKEACRDLSGRRIRDVNIEKRFQNWIAKASERKKEQIRRKKEKLERLRRVPKFEFKDEQYFKVRSEIPERIDSALEYALQKSKSKPNAPCCTVTSSSSSSASATANRSEPGPSTSTTVNMKTSKTSVPVKRKFLTKLGLSKKSRLWVNDDLEVSDEDESHETNSNVDMMAEISIEKTNETIQEEIKTDDSQLLKEKNASIVETSTIPQEPSKDASTDLPVVELKVKKEVQPERLDIENYKSKEELEALGLDRLKAALMFLDMKCGGTLAQRAERLWSVRGIERSKIPKNLLVPKAKK